VLPAFNTALDQTLIADLPLCIDPISCIRADAEHVGSIVQALSTSPQNNEIHHAHFLGDISSKLRVSSCARRFDKQLLIQRLIVYVFAHLLFCSSNRKFVLLFYNESVNLRVVLSAF
jgi:hypothetical protein